MSDQKGKAEPEGVCRAREWYNQTCGNLADGQPIYRWGSFDRAIVGELLSYIDELKGAKDGSEVAVP